MQNTYPLEIDRCEFNCRLPSLAATSLNFSMLYRGNSSGENTGVGEVGDHGKEWLWGRVEKGEITPDRARPLFIFLHDRKECVKR